MVAVKSFIVGTTCKGRQKLLHNWDLTHNPNGAHAVLIQSSQHDA